MRSVPDGLFSSIYEVFRRRPMQNPGKRDGSPKIAQPFMAGSRSPAKSQLVAVRQHRPRAVCGGRTGQRAFEFLATDETRMKHGFFEARQG
jgi:hypothetical protein